MCSKREEVLSGRHLEQPFLEAKALFGGPHGLTHIEHSEQ